MLKKIIVFFSLFSVIALIIFFDFFFNGKTVYLDDLWRVSYPIRHFIKANLEAGNGFVKWCPHILNGIPVTGEGQSAQIYYPFNRLAYYFLTTIQNINFNIIFHFFMSAVFCGILGAYLRLSIGSIIIFSACFSMSGVFLGHHTNVAMASSYPYLPLAFYFFIRWFNTGNLINSLYCGIVCGFNLLTGHPQFFYYSMIFFFVFAVIHLTLGKKIFSLASMKTFYFFCITVVIAVIISYIQLKATFDFVKTAGERSGSGQEIEFFTYISLNFKYLIMLVFPSAFGSASSNSYMGAGFYWEYSAYCSIFTIIVFFISLLQKNKSKLEINIFICVLIFTLLSVLIATPLSKILIFIPGMKMFRVHSRLLYIIVFCLCLNSVLWLEKFRNAEYTISFWQHKFLLLIGCAAVLVILGGLAITIFKDNINQKFSAIVYGKDYKTQNPITSTISEKISTLNFSRVGGKEFYI